VSECHEVGDSLALDQGNAHRVCVCETSLTRTRTHRPSPHTRYISSLRYSLPILHSLSHPRAHIKEIVNNPLYLSISTIQISRDTSIDPHILSLSLSRSLNQTSHLHTSTHLPSVSSSSWPWNGHESSPQDPLPSPRTPTPSHPPTRTSSCSEASRPTRTSTRSTSCIYVRPRRPTTKPSTSRAAPHDDSHPVFSSLQDMESVAGSDGVASLVPRARVLRGQPLPLCRIQRPDRLQRPLLLRHKCVSIGICLS